MKLYVIENYHYDWKSKNSKEILKMFSNRYNLEFPSYLDSGKPLLKQGYISISHSNEFLLIAYSDNPIGIDCEIIRPLQNTLINKLKLDSPNPILDWCKRESVIKLLDDKTYLLKKELNDFHFRTISFNPKLCIVCASYKEINTIELIHLNQDLLIINEIQLSF